MRVFGIGLGRTGTTSLHRALELLGFRSKHCPRFYLDPAGVLCIDQEDIRNHSALTDEPVAPIYRDLDRQYPGARFTLTVRDVDRWLASRENNSRAMREWWDRNPAVAVLHSTLFGSEVFDKHKYAEAYARHLADVLYYFRERDDDLLVLDICAGEGWEKLCPFLGLPIPRMPFPRGNVYRETDYATLLRGLRAGIARDSPTHR